MHAYKLTEVEATTKVDQYWNDNNQNLVNNTFIKPQPRVYRVVFYTIKNFKRLIIQSRFIFMKNFTNTYKKKYTNT